MNVSPELIITFLIGNFVGSFLYRLWRNHQKERGNAMAPLVQAGAMAPNEHRFARGGNFNPRPTYARPPAPPAPKKPMDDATEAMLMERERCAQLADSMDCAHRCRVGQEVGAAIRRQGRWPGQPDPNPRGGTV